MIIVIITGIFTIISLLLLSLLLSWSGEENFKSDYRVVASNLLYYEISGKD